MSIRLHAPRCSARCARGPAIKRSVLVRGRSEDSVAGPYASGILELAQERKIIDEVYDNLMSLQSMLAGEAEKGKEENSLDGFLSRPLQSKERKDVIDSLGSEYKWKSETTDFLKLLIDTNRFDCIDEVIERFEKQYNEITDTQIVTLKSAARLEQDQEFKIAKQLQEMTSSKNIKIKPVIDEALLGGFILEFGDNKIDLSIKGHLDRIKGELLSQE